MSTLTIVEPETSGKNNPLATMTIIETGRVVQTKGLAASPGEPRAIDIPFKPTASEVTLSRPRGGVPEIASIDSSTFQDSVRGLKHDPVVVLMAIERRNCPRHLMVHTHGSLRFEFMRETQNEYITRGGKTRAHLGAVAEAVLQLTDYINDRDGI